MDGKVYVPNVFVPVYRAKKAPESFFLPILAGRFDGCQLGDDLLYGIEAVHIQIGPWVATGQTVGRHVPISGDIEICV